MDKRARARLESCKSRAVTVLACKEDELCLRSDLADACGSVRASAVGQAEIEDDHVRAELSRQGDGLAHRADVADHRHVWLIVEQRSKALGHHLVVLDDQNSDRVRAHRGIGIQNSTLVPAPGSLEILHHPPASRARSLSDRRPRCPGRWSRSETTNPRPLSTTMPWMPPSSTFTFTSTRVAAACFSTLVMASATCRKTTDFNS